MKSASSCLDSRPVRPHKLCVVSPVNAQTGEDIRALLGSYVDCIDRGRLAELVALFAADGVLEITGLGPDVGCYQGRAAIAARLRANVALLAAFGETPRIRHHVASIRITELDAQAAHADSYFLAVTDVGPDHWGRYADEIGRFDDDVWRFMRRRVTVEGFAPGSWIASTR